MNIIKPNYKWAYALTPLKNVTHIAIHHAAGNGSPEAIHNYHKNTNGWAGIAYHIYVRKDGTIYEGRPINMMGGHVAGHNSHTIGICFEGNFETETMSQKQLEAGQAAVAYAKGIYPNAEIVPHKFFGGTVCPGRNFPFAFLLENDEGEPEELANVEPSEWAREAWEWGKAKGITDGNRPQDTATREEMVTMLWRATK